MTEAPSVPEEDVNPPSAGVPMLETRGLARRFGGLQALDAVSFALAPGRILGVIGPNGAGVRISDVRQYLVGGLSPGDAVQDPPELEDAYPENYMFGTLPAYGFFIRHVAGIELDNVAVRYEQTDTRPAFVLRDVSDADFHHVRTDKTAGVSTFVLDDVDDFTVADSRPVADRTTTTSTTTSCRRRG